MNALTNNAAQASGSVTTAPLMSPTPPALSGQTKLPYGDSPTALILAIAVLIRVLVPVMTQRSNRQD